SNEENKTMKSILETTKQVLTQNISIIEKQKALEGMITQLANDIKTLQSIHENFKSNIGDRSHEWWQKGAIQGIKNAIDNWLYPNDKIYEQAIRQELETLCSDRMGRYRRDVKWDALFTKIENSISTESCKYCGALFGSFRCAIFDHIFKKKISPTINSESSESDIIAWKESGEVQWCFENLDSMIEEEDKTYLQMIAKKNNHDEEGEENQENNELNASD
ncbi:4768_t:CDS:2, partial [Cetraspora pellucida]